MILYVYDKTITLLGVVEKITSLVWTEKKYTYGIFEMLLPVTDDNLALLQENRLIMRDDDETSQAGEILYTHIKKSVDGGETLEVTGKLLSHWLSDRLLYSSIESQTLKPQELMRRAVSENAINASPARNYPLLILGTIAETRTQAALDYKSEENITLLDMLEDLGAAEDTGFNINVDRTAKRFKFNTYTGTDHTLESNNPCIFSVEFENILEQEYTRSIENLKNVAYVFGDEKSTIVDDFPFIVGAASGHARKEVFVNSKSVKQGDLTDPEYEAALRTSGDIALKKYAETVNFYNRINSAAGGFKYGKDYTIGDKVTCINTRWGLTINAVITEAQTTYEDGQKSIYLTFGDALPTLLEKIKNIKTR